MSVSTILKIVPVRPHARHHWAPCDNCTGVWMALSLAAEGTTGTARVKHYLVAPNGDRTLRGEFELCDACAWWMGRESDELCWCGAKGTYAQPTYAGSMDGSSMGHEDPYEMVCALHVTKDGMTRVTYREDEEGMYSR